MTDWIKRNKVVQHGLIIGVVLWLAVVVYAIGMKQYNSIVGWTDQPIEELMRK